MQFSPTSDFLAVMIERGFIANSTPLADLDAAFARGVVPGYIGFDATAPSLHAGSLVSIMMLRWLQATGGKPIVLMGGGTTKVGDPSFRTAGRALLSDADIATNIAGISSVFASCLRFGDGPTDAVMVNNADWLDGMDLFGFLRGVGRHFGVHSMLAFDSVKARLDAGEPLSFFEFSYMLLQATDFLELHRRHGCILQMGGSDQWGNIVNGIQLARKADGAAVHALTSPLLTNPDGSKMGKTASGAVWLDPNMLAPFDFWQFWRNTRDADVERFLKLFTELPVDECRRLGALGGAEINQAKIALANAVCSLIHGPQAAHDAEQAARGIFLAGPTTGNADWRQDAADTVNGLPTLVLDTDDIANGAALAHLVVRAGLATSGKEAKRLIADGGLRIDGEPARDPNARLDGATLAQGLRLSAGKKRHALVRAP